MRLVFDPPWGAVKAELTGKSSPRRREDTETTSLPVSLRDFVTPR
jgi:hypothetical protein